MNKYYLIILFLFTFLISHSQNVFTDIYFEKARLEIDSMLSGKKPLDFKKAVSLSENAYFENSVDYSKFDSTIQFYTELIEAYMQSNPLIYKGADYENVARNSAIFSFMTDTTWFTDKYIAKLPYSYNFNDYNGDSDWTNTFVFKLLETNLGNCRSLPYLYKILSEELGAKAYLALAPNHMYIRCYSERTGWYNVELTNAMFPIDAWISASGYIQLEAIQKGVFMDTLSLKQSVTFCLFDLAKNCEKKYGFKTFPFISDCLDTVLVHYPNCINALIYKAEILKKRFDIYMNLYDAKEYTEILQYETPNEIYTEMESLYVKILEFGYREMPEKMYREWLISLNQNKEKYNNLKIKFNFR